MTKVLFVGQNVEMDFGALMNYARDVKKLISSFDGEVDITFLGTTLPVMYAIKLVYKMTRVHEKINIHHLPATLVNKTNAAEEADVFVLAWDGISDTLDDIFLEGQSSGKEMRFLDVTK